MGGSDEIARPIGLKPEARRAESGVIIIIIIIINANSGVDPQKKVGGPDRGPNESPSHSSPLSPALRSRPR